MMNIKNLTKLLVLTISMGAYSYVQASEVILELNNQDLDQLIQSNNFGLANLMYEQGYQYPLPQQQQQQPNGQEVCMDSSTTGEFTYAAGIQKMTDSEKPSFYVSVSSATKSVQLNDVLDAKQENYKESLDQYSVLECRGYKQTPSYRWYAPHTQRQQYSHPETDPEALNRCLVMGGAEEKCRESAKRYSPPYKASPAEIDCMNQEKNKTIEYKITGCRIIRADQQRLQNLSQLYQIAQQKREIQQPQKMIDEE